MTAVATELSTNSGTKTADGTEQTLGESSNMSNGGVFELDFNTENMAAGDVLEVRAYTNDGVNAAYKLCDFVSFAHAQAVPQKKLIPISVETGGRLKFTLKQAAGTNRDYYWKAMKL